MEIINRQNKILFEGFSIFALLLLITIIIISAFTTHSPLLFVVIGFLPSLITIILSIILYEEAFHYKLTIWFIPLIIAGSFFIIGTNYEYMNYNMDIATLTSINIIYSVLYLTMFFTIIRITKKKPKPIQEPKPKLILQQPEQNIQEYIASIEEKSKALNFVIGRVYNKYHGGTQELRKSINLKADWYNELSEALQNEDKTDTKRLFTIIEKIDLHLKNLKKPENEVLTKKQLQDLKNLDRDKEGKDTILEVLMKNDADPVELYYKGMQEFCETIRKELQEEKQIKK